MNIELKGHSGCKLELIEMGGGNTFCVRKFSSCENYNYRLKRQYIKQKLFVNSKNIFTPICYSHDYSDELFYFDMEYIKGINFAEYFKNITNNDVIYYIDLLITNLTISRNTKINYSRKINNNKIFLSKINELKNKNIESPEYYKALELLEKFDWNKIEYSICHGDLTLENIIIDDNKNIYLIDFLDSFFNSWMIDAAKILQDLDIKWSFRKNKLDTNFKIKLDLAKNLFIKNIRKIDNNNNDCLLNIYFCLLLNIVRIYPYTKDEQTFNFLNKSINKILITIKRREND